MLDVHIVKRVAERLAPPSFSWIPRQAEDDIATIIQMSGLIGDGARCTGGGGEECIITSLMKNCAAVIPNSIGNPGEDINRLHHRSPGSPGKLRMTWHVQTESGLAGDGTTCPGCHGYDQAVGLIVALR